MKVEYYNNLGIGIISIGFVLNHIERVSVSKATLILPFISHNELLSYLGRKTTQIRSIEKLIVNRSPSFSNFNKRFFSSLVLTFNSLQYLNDMGYIRIENGDIIKLKNISYHNKMGKRAEKIEKASSNIANILHESTINLFLNLRIEI
ncbi:MAG: hypothetical protein KDE33_14665 [Bacteroidetes bacterium]|nr:hypothetical protein [Bacteroidota bacterium]